MTLCRRLPSLVAVALTVLVACSPIPNDDEPVMKIAFFQDLSVPDSLDLVSPSFLAFEMVMQREVVEAKGIAVEVVQLDTAGEAEVAVTMAREVAADPMFVLAVLAPFWQEPPEVARILAEGGLPTMSLSQVSASPWLSAALPAGEPGELWRRLVPDRQAEAELLAEIAGVPSPDGAPQPVCLVNDGSAYGAGLLKEIDAALDAGLSRPIEATDAAVAAAEVESSGCSIVVWGGFPPGARDLARAMREAGSAHGRPLDLAGAALKTAIPPTSPAGEDAVVGSVACPCADVTVDLDLASRRFVNAYQSAHGLIPGIYAAEAWDAGRIVGDAMTSRSLQRDEMRAAFSALAAYQGVARTYTFDAAGELIGARAGLFVAAGTRWLPFRAEMPLDERLVG